jgi:outer membrane protein TolC
LKTRQDILLSARLLWIDAIYLKRKEQMLGERLLQAREINEHFRQMLDEGEVSSLEYGQSNLQLAALQGEYGQLQSDLRNNHLALREICGGTDPEIHDTLFPLPHILVQDSLLLEYEDSPDMQLYRLDRDLKLEQKKVSVSQNLPKLSAGYYSESVLAEDFRGFQLGVTVPLWENANRIKQARSELAFAETDAERFSYLQETRLLQKIEQLESLETRILNLEEALSRINGPELLSEALNSGEISFTEYFYSTDLYFRNRELLLAYRKDLMRVEADLMKIYY